MRVSFVVQEEGQWTLDICRKPSAQCRIGRGWSWAPGWVTVVSLCCFCNVALIFATMKTFILQQVKCCHLSPFLFKLILCRIFPQSILPLNFFFFFFFFFCITSFPLLPSSLAFHFGDHHPQTPSPMLSSFSDSLPQYLSKWRSQRDCVFSFVLFCFSLRWWAERFNISEPFICPDLSLLTSAMGSQLLMKSPSVL